MSQHTITLRTADEKTVVFTAAEGEDIISAAEKQEIILPQQCRSGACGFCTATTVQGNYSLRDYDSALLTDELQNQGRVLLCRTYPHNAMTIQVPYSYAAIRFMTLPNALCTIVQKEYVTATVIALTLQQQELSNVGLLSSLFRPGQYMQLSLPDNSLRRAYSLANTPNWSGTLQFFIQLHSEGWFSSILRQAQVGDSLMVRGPFGDFQLQEGRMVPRWFIAGGTGISPILSLLQELAENDDRLLNRLYFGVKHPEHCFAMNHLETIAQQLPRFNYMYCVSQPAASIADKASSATHHHSVSASRLYWGSIIEKLECDLQAHLKSGKALPDFYLCGSTRLQEGIRALITRYGIDETHLFYESFN